MVLTVGAVLLLALLPTAHAAGVVNTRVLENTPERVVIDYSLGPFTRTAVDIAGRNYVQIRLDKEGVTTTAGAPELPKVCRSIIIPDDAEMAVRVLASSYYELSDIAVSPSKGTLYRNQDPDKVPYAFGPVYAADAFYPPELVSLSAPYILRDWRGVVVELQPIQYNPVTQTLRVYTEVTVEVVPRGPGQINVLDRSLRNGDELSLAFHQIYTHHFLNYVLDPRYTPLNETGSLLIICYDTWLSNVQPLVNHKNAIGISTTAVGVSTIPGGNTATAIKNYIQTVYNAGGLAFILLVGDGTQVKTPTASGGSADPTYALLAGGDHYPDIIVGRFSAETAAQVDTQVQRTVEYEQLPATTQAWFKRGVGIGSAEGDGIGDDGEMDKVHIENIRTDLLGYSYTVVDQIYDPGATAAQVSTAVNAGRGIINYCGHGSTTSWGTTGFSNTNVNALTNDNMLPFIFSVACVNGQFDGYTCFAEAWLRAIRASEPIGAIGMYASSINQSWAPPMAAQDESVDLLVAEAYFSFGALCFAGSCRMMDEYGADGQAMYDTWHVFGDPSLRVFGQAGTPHGLNVTPSGGLVSSGPAGGPFTPGSIAYTLENLNDTPINYNVTKTQTWVSLSNTSGTLTGHATTTVTVSINSSANTLGNGNYSDTVNFINTTDHDGDTTRSVALQVGVPQLVYSFPMNTNPGWTTQGSWAFGHPTGGGGAYGGPDPSNGYTDTNVYGYNLSGDYTNNMPEYHLTSTAINCSNLSSVSLKFWRWLGVEQLAYDHAYVRVSNNGSTYTTLWSNGSTLDGGSWVQDTFDISAVADNQPTVYLRWTMGTTDGSWTYCGWNIDDVEIWGVQAGPAPTCSDGILNQGEQRIDCGGPCPACQCLADATCDDGAFCTGSETCDAYGHCQNGSYPCTAGQWCDEVGNTCVPNPSFLGNADSVGTGCNLLLSNGQSEPRTGGVRQLNFQFNGPPSGVGPVVQWATCANPTFQAYAGASVMSCARNGNDLRCTFTPALEGAHTYRFDFTGLAVGNPTFAVRALVGDVDSDGFTTGSDRTTVHANWGTANCAADVDEDGQVGGADRTEIHANWGACAP